MSQDLRELQIPPRGLQAVLGVPDLARGLVVFAHGSGSGRLSPRNRRVAGALQRARFATLLLDLLAAEEEGDRTKVFDIPLLAARLGETIHWARTEPAVAALPIGCFGASTGAGAALLAAAEFGADAADRRQPRHARGRAQPPGAGAAALREGDVGGAGCRSPVRGTGNAGCCRRPRDSLVRAPPSGRRRDARAGVTSSAARPVRSAGISRRFP